MELVGPALHDQIQPHAAGRLLDVLARRRDLNLFKIVPIEISRRTASCSHIRDIDTVYRPDRVLRTCTFRLKIRLLAGLVAANVNSIDKHARYRPHQGKRIPRSRNTLKFDGGEVRSRANLQCIDDWSDLRHDHRRKNSGDPHGDLEVNVFADFYNDVLL